MTCHLKLIVDFRNARKTSGIAHCCHVIQGKADGARSQVEPYAGTNGSLRHTNVPEDRLLFGNETVCVASASSHPLEVPRTIEVEQCSKF